MSGGSKKLAQCQHGFNDEVIARHEQARTACQDLA